MKRAIIILTIGFVAVGLLCWIVLKKSVDEKFKIVTETIESANQQEKELATANRECESRLKDSELPGGAFVKYIIKDGIVKIKWGNTQMSRVLKDVYDCNSIPNAIPWVDKSSSRYIVMRYGCGTPCWGVLILPLTTQDSVTHIMSDIDIDLIHNQIVYIDSGEGSLKIEDLKTHAIQSVKPKIDCKAAFMGFCIDSVRLANNNLYLEWIEWDNNVKTKVVQSVDVKL